MKILFDICLTVFVIIGISSIIALYLPIIRKQITSRKERILKIILISVLIFVIIGLLLTLVFY